MNSWPADVRLATPVPPSAGNSDFARRLYFVLAVIALIYAFLGGLRTVSDFDLGWQMATGRWIVQHHSIPSVDVLSYTAAGQPWIYPVASGIIFYIAYLAGGYALLSWLGAITCVGTTALLLRRGSPVTAALAILAVPLIALRMTPRADMFTVVLFAAFLSLLWEQYRTGQARMWLLPLLMLAWVNLHVGFIAGLGLVAAYVVIELLDAALGKSTGEAVLQRLRRSAPWLAMTLAATLVNPWGWDIYRAIILQQRVAAQHAVLIAEWGRVPLSWAALATSFSVRQTGGSIYILLAIAVVAAAVALLRAQLGVALLLVAAIYAGLRYARMASVFACVVVIVGGALLSQAGKRLEPYLGSLRLQKALASCAVALLALIAGVRCYDLATNRFYTGGTSESSFGAGLSWWFPQRAVEFIRAHNLPGEVFNTYNEGGFVAWALGPERQDSIDGRAIPFGIARMEREGKLARSSPDSPIWQDEVDRYLVNTILLPLGRFDGVQLLQLQAFCSSALWQPVYLDEVSAVLVRRTPETAELRQQFPLDCATAALPISHRDKGDAKAFDAWSNAAAVLSALGRKSEALSAIDNALDTSPDSAFAHWLRGGLLSTMARPDESEEEYLKAVSLRPSDVTWSALADSYRDRGRTADAIDAMQHAIALSPRAYSLIVNLGYLYLRTHQPQHALRMFDEAERNAPADIRLADNGTFDFMVAQGRSAAWDELGDLARATSFQEQAVQIQSNAPEPWRRLAKLYRRGGRVEDATRADENAAKNAGAQQPAPGSGESDLPK